LTYVGLFSLAASLANPYGWKLYVHVYSYLSNRFLMNHIEEFRSPDFHGAAQKCFLLLLLITLAALAVRGRELRMSQVLTVLFAVCAGLYASRNIPVSSVLLVMVVGPLLPTLRPGQKLFQKMAAVESRLRGHLWPILAVLVTFLIAANGGRAGSSRLMDAHFDSGRMPVEAVNYIEGREIKGPVLSPDYWGGYLIYRLFPRSKVVVDDRHDLYGAEFLKTYLKMVHVEVGWQEFLREHEISCIVMPADSALTNILGATAGWREIYRDNTAVVFVKAESHASSIANQKM